ncbi:flavodoxin family protein [bacterium]|nr:flavodoxin family protein [bacterium]
MKIIGVMCSPRRGANSDTMVTSALAGATELGAETKAFVINDMNIKGCQACMYCKTHDGCAVQDDMQLIYKELADADGVVIGAPVYMWQYCAQARLFIDRLYCYMNLDFTAKINKPALVLISQGNDNPDTFVESLKKTGLIGLSVKDMIIAADANQPDCVSKQPELLERIKQAGKKLVS